MRRLVPLLLLAAAAAAEHVAVELECPADAPYRVARDLDGDGLDDLLLVTGSEAWLWHGRREGFRRAPDARMPLPKGTAFFDVGPAGAAKQHLVARTAGGYFAVRPGAEPERLALASGFGLPPNPANLLWRGFFRDFDRDGAMDWIDVSLAGYAILFGGGGAVTIPPRLLETADTAAGAASDRIVARYAVGDWTDGDFDGDGRPDFAVMTPGGLLVYPGDDDGRFDPARNAEIGLGVEEDADLFFQDLNADGKTDVLAVRRKAGRAEVLIAGGDGLKEPRRIRLAIPGEIRSALVDDLDGDGRPDLGLPFIPHPSVRMAVRAFVQGEVILKVPIFLNRGGDAPIGVRADKQVSLPVKIRVGTDSEGRITLSGLVVVEYGGDLDGDGRKDLVVTSKPTLLDVYRGVDGSIFADEAAFRIAIPDCSEYDTVRSVAANLNGDARADIVLQYRGGGRRPDRLVLLLSRD